MGPQRRPEENPVTYLCPWVGICCSWGHSLRGLCDHARGSLIGRWLGHASFYPAVEKAVLKKMSNTDGMPSIEKGKFLLNSTAESTDTQGKQALCWAVTFEGCDYFLTPPRDLKQPTALRWKTVKAFCAKQCTRAQITRLNQIKPSVNAHILYIIYLETTQKY